MVAYLDDHRDRLGVEPICAVLPIAPSTYFLHKAQQQDPTQRSIRARRDDDLRAAIQRVATQIRVELEPHVDLGATVSQHVEDVQNL